MCQRETTPETRCQSRVIPVSDWPGRHSNAPPLKEELKHKHGFSLEEKKRALFPSLFLLREEQPVNRIERFSQERREERAARRLFFFVSKLFCYYFFYKRGPSHEEFRSQWPPRLHNCLCTRKVNEPG